MSFLDSLQQRAGRTARTENGALSNVSTHDSVLDFFALAGGMRDNQAAAIDLFRKALAEDRQLAIRALFYLRDVRGGQGERNLFRVLFSWLRVNHPDVAAQVRHHIPQYGRWDDLIRLSTVDEAFEIVDQQLAKDIEGSRNGESVSLLAKWMPSENTSSPATRELARQWREAFGMTPREYRKSLVQVRSHLRILEQQMSANDWENIDYGRLPSQAARKHTKAFKRHDGDRYERYLDGVLNGTEKMNAATVYTYEVFDLIRQQQIKPAEAMWASLPDYTDGRNAIVVADVSGSMSGRPMDVSVSLALYFAERNTGPFAGHFITFTTNPQLVRVQGNSLAQRLYNIQSAEWGSSTNVAKVFDLLLETAVHSGASQEDLPSTIYIISDMEFDEATNTNSYEVVNGRWQYVTHEATNYEAAKAKFEAAGYELPHVVFWNVNARSTQVPATKHDGAVTLISGLSQSTFRYAVEGKTPLELMDEVLNGERYAPIVVD